jgi:hypothetical protein
MIRRIPVFLALLVAFALSGCIVVPDNGNGGGGGGGGASNGGGGGGGGGGGQMTSTLTVVNNASQAVHYIYFSAHDDSSWGDDMLGTGVLMPGNTQTIRCTPGDWDIKCRMANGQDLIYWDQHFNGDYTLTIHDE